VAGVFWLFKRGHDPNNVIGPLVTTMGDVVSIVALAVALAVLL
jgi:cation transporter-like permease